MAPPSPQNEPHKFPTPVPAKVQPTDHQSLADIRHVEEHGYVILRNVFSPEEAEDAKREICRLSEKDGLPATGRNEFEGRNTTRIYALLNKTRAFDKFVVLDRVMKLNEWFLDPGYNITAFHTIQINPGESAQELHHDDGYCNLPRPRPPLSTAIMVAFDPFTSQNGATRLLCGSHTWPSSRPPSPNAPEALSATCPAGSVVYFLGTTWHGGGANESETPRASLTVQYCQPYIRPIENQLLAVDPRKLSEIPERIVGMMGYATMKPFIGYADGMSPRYGVSRLMEWARKPVDKSPPTFAYSMDGKGSKL